MMSVMSSVLRLCVGLLAAVLISVGLATWLGSWWFGVLGCTLVVAVMRWRQTWLMIRTSRRDLTAASRYYRSGAALLLMTRRHGTVPELFRRRVACHPNRVMFIESKRQWTFQEVEDYSNRLANYFAGRGLKAGDDVALVMENRADVVILWLAMAKLGVVTALVNYNLRRTPLLHCVTAVRTKAVIFSPKMAPFVLEISSDLYEKLEPQFLSYGATDLLSEFPPGAENLIPDAERSAATAPSHRGSIDDRLLYIYTSGTTGLPKAAVIKHRRYIYLATHIYHMMPLKASDVLYVCLPLYHMAGGVLGSSQSVVNGLTAVVVPKFSATSFWTDCIEYNCTVAQYIGETCRYLYAQPKRDTDRQHGVRLMFGNGLRPQLWTEFRERFGVKHIREIYGSTEGNTNLINTDDTAGCVGFMPTICRNHPMLAPLFFPLGIIKVDPATGVPLRGKNGLCIRVGPNEPGEVVAPISDKALLRFDGYTDSAATSKKIYRDVFRKGDQCFSSGDILVFDDLGYAYFKDRTGDTFRWRGENVSTAEVEAIISRHTGDRDCVVYGVEVPGNEGKAGMAALHSPDDQKVDLVGLLAKMRAELPAYAIPLFVRLTKTIELTSTFKLKKVDLAREAYNTEKISDPIYFFDKKADAYVPMDNDIYSEIMSARRRL